jgi:PEP-CTERM motif-containing protein
MSKRIRNTETPSLQFEKRLVRYALAGGAVLALPAASHAGTIDYFVANQPVTTVNSPYPFSFDGSQVDFTLTAAIPDTDITTEVSANPMNGSQFVGSGDPYALTFGTPISGASPLTTDTKLSAYGFVDDGPFFNYKGNWSPSGTPAYLGALFNIVGDPNPHFGWVQIETFITPTTASAEIVDYAYNTVGYNDTNAQQSSILAGEETTASSVAPEPSSLALYAVGAAGILALRRRKLAA